MGSGARCQAPESLHAKSSEPLVVLARLPVSYDLQMGIRVSVFGENTSPFSGCPMSSLRVLIPTAHNSYMAERYGVVDRLHPDAAKTQRCQLFLFGMSLYTE